MSNYDILISKLDQFTRKYYLNQLVRGILLFAGILAAFYVLASLGEYQWYFPGGVRKTILAVFVILAGITLYTWIVKPLLGYMKLGNTLSNEQAAKVIGDHFSNIQDKLLNILQLKAAQGDNSSLALIEAGINQKIEGIRLVPFTSAINLGENRKYLRCTLPPLLLIAGLILFAPGVLRQSTQRLMNPGMNFPRQAPFDFYLLTKQLKVVQFEDLEVKMTVNGKMLPAECKVEVEGRSYKMQKKGNEYSYRFTNIQEAFDFQFVANGFYSSPYRVKVVHKPLIIDFVVSLDYPAYTGKQDEVISNTGDLFIPAGTVVNWKFDATHTESLSMRLGGQMVETIKDGEQSFHLSRRLITDMMYSVFVKNKEFPAGDSVTFQASVTADRAPAIRVEQLGDTLSPAYQFFIGDIADDYGFSKLELHYAVNDANGTQLENKRIAIPFKKGVSMTDFTYSFNTAAIKLAPGYSLDYYFEIWDNDGVSGAKSARSQTFSVKKPSEEQFEKLEEQNNESIKDDLSLSQKKMKQMAARIKELKERVVSKKNFSWEDKKAFEDLMKEQQQMVKELNEMKEKFQENIARQEEFKEVDPEILEKQQKLEELMKELLTDDMKKMMDELSKLLEDLQQKNALDKLDNMEMGNEKVNNELDKMLELFKQLEFQQKVYETAEKLDKLAEDQEQLSKETKEGQQDNQQLQEKQEDLNKEFDKVKEDIDKAGEMNEKLGNPADLDKPKDMSEDVQEDMKNSSDKLEQNQPQQAAPKQKNASEKMKQMAHDMRKSMEMMMAQQDGEDMENMRQLLENLVELSFDQEKLMKEFGNTETDNPKYVKLIQEQFKLQDDMKMIDDSLQSLAKRQFQLQKFITDEAFQIRRELTKSIDYLEQRNKRAAAGSQQYVMTSANNLALMLSESLQQMQQQMRQAMQNPKPGSGQCDKPGGEGDKPSMQQMQQKLGEQLRQAQDMMKQGKDPRKMSKEFGQMAETQAAIREALRKMKESMSQQQKGDSKVDNLMQQMDNIERELANKKLTEEMLKRNKDIETRLLELERAQREQGDEEQRKSNTAKEVPPKMPAALEEYLKKRKSEMDVYKTVPPSLKPFYKNLVEKYYKSIN